MIHHIHSGLASLEEAENTLAQHNAKERWGRGFYTPQVISESDGTYAASWWTGDSSD